MEQIKARPILFSTEMVKAILSGAKTQTRRVIKPQPLKSRETFGTKDLFCWWHTKGSDLRDQWFSEYTFKAKMVDFCPYGKVGDRLFVKETFQKVDTPNGHAVFYKADERFLGIEFGEENALTGEGEPIGLRADIYPQGRYFGIEDFPLSPSIFMPRWASRITLEITNIRVERLQDISWEDAASEGVDAWGERNCPGCSEDWGCPRPYGIEPVGCLTFVRGYVVEFERLWNEINAKRGYPWNSSPWVWVIEFKKV